MRIAYIAHPLSGNIARNINRIRDIVRKINLEEPDVVPFVPYYADIFALDDEIPEERDRGIKNDIELMKRGFIDELRLYGNRVSDGMRKEILLAIDLNIRIVPMTYDTIKYWRKMEWL